MCNGRFCFERKKILCIPLNLFYEGHYLFQFPVIVKEYSAINHVNFCNSSPGDYLVTCSSKVCLVLNIIHSILVSILICFWKKRHFQKCATPNKNSIHTIKVIVALKNHKFSVIKCYQQFVEIWLSSHLSSK